MTHSEAIKKAFTDGIRKAGDLEDVKKLAEQGNAEMQFVLAVECLLDNNISGAAPWLEKSANHGHELAQFCFGNYLDEEFRYEEAEHWWIEAAKQGNATAIEKLLEQGSNDGLYTDLAKKFIKEQCEERSNQWMAQGLCPIDGGRFKGMFSKKCEKCGRPQNKQ